jgi:hypothetical protein
VATVELRAAAVDLRVATVDLRAADLTGYHVTRLSPK